jgi:hypothetical protein
VRLNFFRTMLVLITPSVTCMIARIGLLKRPRCIDERETVRVPDGRPENDRSRQGTDA